MLYYLKGEGCKRITLTLASFETLINSSEIGGLMFEKEIKDLLKKYVKEEIILEVPPGRDLGDYAFPCFSLAKKLGKSPNEVANDLMKKIKPSDVVEHIEANGPYLNLFVSRQKLAEKVLLDITYKKEKYGSSAVGKGRTVVMDFSHPNIAKPFGIGHLRSTVIGNSLYQLLKFSGYKVVRVNHLGDWGTQFGSLIYAYLSWGDKEKLKKEPIKHLLELYVKFHKLSSKDKSLEEEARRWFKKLEGGDREARKLWAKFRKLSFVEFNRIYTLLNVEFDSYDGESFYVDKLEHTMKKAKRITSLSEGALVVSLKKYNMPPFILRKSDEASTYGLRDLAALIYRMKTYRPERILYVVGSEQSLHFNQLFTSAELLGYGKENFAHIPFGLYRLEEGRMATREGRIVFMEDVLNRAIGLAKKTVQEKNPYLKNKDDTALLVGVGAVVFGDLVNDRIKDIVFDWKKILDFEGDTAPYVQYAYARASSIMRKARGVKLEKINFSLLKEDAELKIIFMLSDFPDKISEALKLYKPHILAHHLLELARAFNEFYQKHQVLNAESELKKARLALVNCTRTVLKAGLALLGIQVPEEM